MPPLEKENQSSDLSFDFKNPASINTNISHSVIAKDFKPTPASRYSFYTNDETLKYYKGGGGANECNETGDSADLEESSHLNTSFYQNTSTLATNTAAKHR